MGPRVSDARADEVDRVEDALSLEASDAATGRREQRGAEVLRVSARAARSLAHEEVCRRSASQQGKASRTVGTRELLTGLQEDTHDRAVERLHGQRILERSARCAPCCEA